MALIWDCSSKLPLPLAKSDYLELRSVNCSWFHPLSPPHLVLLYSTWRFSSLELKVKITHCETPQFYKGKHDTAQCIPEKGFFPFLLTTVELLTQEGLALNLIECKWLLPLEKMHIPILRIPVLSELSAGAERWALVRHAVKLCKFPISVLNCLFWLKKKICRTHRCEVLPDGFWEIPIWRESIKWPLQILFWGFLSLYSVLVRAIHLAACEIRFTKSLRYLEISPRQDFLTRGPVHVSISTLCCACLLCKVHETSLQRLHL